MDKDKQASESDQGLQTLITFLEAERATRGKADYGSVKLATSDLALALVAGFVAAAAAWRLGVNPPWLAVVPVSVLVATYAVMGAFQALIAYAWWRRRREESP